MNTSQNKLRALLLEGVHQNSVVALSEAGYDVELFPKSLPTEELKQKIKDVHFIGIRSRTQLTADVLDQAQNLLAIGCFCIGTNQVDLSAAQAKGIPVFNAPFSNTRSVAELTIASAIHLMRGVPAKNSAAHRGEWQKSAKNSFEVRKKKLGIVGYGNIGSQLSVIASGLGMHVYYYDIENKLPHGNARMVESLNELLALSDIVTLHVPATEQTKNLIGEKEFEAMKDGSFLINYSRGNVVDIKALAENLKSGKILGAAVDVFPEEPKSAEEEFLSPLREFENVLLTPHIGGSTQEAQENIGLEVAEKLIKYQTNGTTRWSVNFPEIMMPEPKSNTVRFTHIHQNEPGMLQKINDIIYQKQINILGQSLQTKDQIGYVVIDLEKTNQTHEIFPELKDIPGTIQARIL